MQSNYTSCIMINVFGGFTFTSWQMDRTGVAKYSLVVLDVFIPALGSPTLVVHRAKNGLLSMQRKTTHIWTRNLSGHMLGF